MRTSQTPIPSLPAKLMGIPEMLSVLGIMLGAIVITGTLYQSWGWSQETVALVIVGTIFGGFALWAIVRTYLVRRGLIHPLLIGPSVEAEEACHGQR